MTERATKPELFERNRPTNHRARGANHTTVVGGGIKAKAALSVYNSHSACA
jgi:hypothetical protein